jgi:hypothetical protein
MIILYIKYLVHTLFTYYNKTMWDKEKQRLSYQKWYKKKGVRNRSLDYKDTIERWRKEHMLEAAVKQRVRRAVKSGKLIKPKLCMKCGREVRLSGHHEDYSLPLDVLWVCSSCHKLLHLIKEKP